MAKRFVTIKLLNDSPHLKVVTHKIWLVRENGIYKVSNYYSLRTNYFVHGEDKNSTTDIYKKGDYDAIGIKFPF